MTRNQTNKKRQTKRGMAEHKHTWRSPAKVSSVKPAAVREGFLCALGVIVVAFHDPRALGQDHPLLPICHVLVALGIHYS